MIFCTKCGNKLEKNVKFCPNCGNGVEQKENKEKEVEEKIKNGIEKIMDTPDSTDKFTKKDVKDNMGFALISYLGILVLIPYFLGKSSKFVQYHAKQGMNLLIVWALYMVVYNLFGLIKISKSVTYFGYIGSYKVTPWWINTPLNIVGILISLIVVIGIVNVCQGKAKELPIIGKLKIVK